MEAILNKVKQASRKIAKLLPSQKNEILMHMAHHLIKHSEKILQANNLDVLDGIEASLDEAFLDRLKLDNKRLNDMSLALEQIALLPEPVGRLLDGWQTSHGLKIEKISIPIGVIGIIYESRPNVTSDTAGLCFKSGNACVLKGGKESKRTNEAIIEALQEALDMFNTPKEAVVLLPDYSHDGVKKLLQLDKYIDLIIPRGGEKLINFVVQNSKVPVIKHDKGLCHIFVDKSADFDSSLEIIVNAKCQRLSACNTIETLLVHEDVSKTFLPIFKTYIDKYQTILKGCKKTNEIIEVLQANDEDFYVEHLANILCIRVVSDIDEAIEHINEHGSSHSESILTQCYKSATKFTNEVDSACVYVNASTRFSDGGEFGFGAEVGISTSKLHARGPMGINDLTTYKYMIYGQNHIRK